MLEKTFNEIYMKFKLNFYKNIFRTVSECNNRLSATEAFFSRGDLCDAGAYDSRICRFCQHLANQTLRIKSILW